MKNRTGTYFGYFTCEIIKDGVHFFEFTDYKHVSLVERTSGIVHKKGKDDSFQIKIVIPEGKRDYVRQLTDDQTLIVAEFKNGNLSEVYTLNPKGVCGISA